ncbi:hypothetical protein DRP07_06525 [Archaeoglobales archaeon]|nr:MAG: hypothetical protein DRP07_06525 [Archaeoglobales archaeon]
MIAIVLFIMFSLYLGLELIRIAPVYLRELRNENVRSEVYQVSELLINDPGEPADWENFPSAIRRIGLNSKRENRTNLLSSDKIRMFNQICEVQGRYDDVAKWIGTDYQFYIIMINKTDDAVLINCYPQDVTAKEINATISRLVAFDSGDFGELIVQMW